jgi:hypothetical protein
MAKLHTWYGYVSLEILMLGNLDEKSLFFAAMDTATLRARVL